MLHCGTFGVALTLTPSKVPQRSYIYIYITSHNTYLSWIAIDCGNIFVYVFGKNMNISL